MENYFQAAGGNDIKQKLLHQSNIKQLLTRFPLFWTYMYYVKIRQFFLTNMCKYVEQWGKTEKSLYWLVIQIDYSNSKGHLH